MATVKMTDNLVDTIVDRFTGSFTADREALPQYEYSFPNEVGEELYSCFMPLADEQAIRDLYKDRTWALSTMRGIYVNHSPAYTYCTFAQPRLFIPRTPQLKPPGFKSLQYDGHMITFELEDIEKVEGLPHFKKYMRHHAEVQTKHEDLDMLISEQADDLRSFLDQFTTLQQAVKEFGPSLMTWVPKYQKDLYNKERTSRKKAPLGEDEKPDISEIVARAVGSELNMNGENPHIPEHEDSPHFDKVWADMAVADRKRARSREARRLAKAQASTTAI